MVNIGTEMHKEYNAILNERSTNCIDMRAELARLQDEFAIDVLYIRNNKFVKCTCFDDVNKTGRPGCPKCFGSGYFASVQKFRAIESSISAYSGANKTTPMPVGAIDYKEEVFYMDYRVNPAQRDYILKVSWKDGLPVDVIKVHEISNVYEMRGDSQGRVEVFGCHITNRPDAVRQFDDFLKKLPRKALRVLKRGDKFIWPYKLVN